MAFMQLTLQMCKNWVLSIYWSHLSSQKLWELQPEAGHEACSCSGVQRASWLPVTHLKVFLCQTSSIWWRVKPKDSRSFYLEPVMVSESASPLMRCWELLKLLGCNVFVFSCNPPVKRSQIQINEELNPAHVCFHAGVWNRQVSFENLV